VALGICVLAISYLAFAPLDQPPLTPSDKLNHVLAFGVLAWLTDMAYPGRRLAPRRWAFLLGYGMAIESIQHFLPYRHFSLLDFAADAAGVLLYCIVVAWRRRKGNTGPVQLRH
jgi:VanZ family protein